MLSNSTIETLEKQPIEDYRAEFAEVESELDRATSNYGSFTSSYEGYAVIKEELDELWEQVKKKPHDRDPNYLRREACQVAAMAIRFMSDCAPNPTRFPGPPEIPNGLDYVDPIALPLVDFKGWKRYNLPTGFVTFDPLQGGLADAIRQRNQVVAFLDSLPPHELYQKYYDWEGNLRYWSAVDASELQSERNSK